MRKTTVPSTPVHLTYRLYGSIPNLPLQQLHDSHRLRLLELKKRFPTVRQEQDRSALKDYRDQTEEESVRFYLGYDDLLDRALVGPTYLAGQEAKDLVVESWHTLARMRKLTIYAISVMSNHVHVILASQEETSAHYLEEVLRDHKRFTGTRLNRLHGTPGRQVWAEKEYHRTIQRGKFAQVFWYVLNNPVKAGLTADGVNWFGNWWAVELKEAFVDTRAA